jgi:hypothetical protein
MMMTFETAEDYLTALENDPSLAILPLQMVADYRGVTRAAIDRMVRIGQLEEIKIEGTRYVRAESLLQRQKGREQQIKTVRTFLEAWAREQARKDRKPLTYEPVMAEVGMSPSVPADRTTIGGILDVISQQTWEEHQIILSVIVHRKTAGRTRPGPGFFQLTKRLGLYDDDEDDLIERESQKVWNFYAKG